MLYGKITTRQLELMRAIEDGLKDEVVRLVKVEGVDPNFLTENAIRSPIYLAIHNDDYEITKWLIGEGGVRVDKKILEWAGLCGNPSLCKLILNKLEE